MIFFFVAAAFATGSVDFSRLFDIAPTEGNSEFLPFGAIGILFALPFAIWFFLGIEELPLAAEESHTPAKDIPKAGVWGVVSLTLFGLLVLFVNPAVTGTAALTVSPGDGDEPLLAGFRAFMPPELAAVLALFALVGLLASLQGIMFAYGRNMYSLSRAGYYPKFLSLTSAKRQMPWVALVVGGVIGYLILTLVLVVLPAVNPDAASSATGVILFIAVFGAVVSYMLQMVAFILLRRKFPNAKRPWKSPTGVWGAVVALILAFGAFLGIVLNVVFQTAVITFVIAYAVGILLFALFGRHRLVLSPEEEYALSGGEHGDPQTEGYDAMEERGLQEVTAVTRKAKAPLRSCSEGAFVCVRSRHAVLPDRRRGASRLPGARNSDRTGGRADRRIQGAGDQLEVAMEGARCRGIPGARPRSPRVWDLGTRRHRAQHDGAARRRPGAPARAARAA